MRTTNKFYLRYCFGFLIFSLDTSKIKKIVLLGHIYLSIYLYTYIYLSIYPFIHLSIYPMPGISLYGEEVSFRFSPHMPVKYYQHLIPPFSNLKVGDKKKCGVPKNIAQFLLLKTMIVEIDTFHVFEHKPCSSSKVLETSYRCPP